MKKLFYFGVAILLIVSAIGFMLSVAPGNRQPAPEYDPAIAAAKRAAELARLDRERATSDFWALALPATYCLIIFVLVGLVVYGIYQHSRRENHRRAVEVVTTNTAAVTLEPDLNGNFPARVIAGQLITVAPGNIIQPVPHSLHYAPNFKSDQATRPLPTDQPPAALASGSGNVLATVPTFSELLARAEIDLTGQSLLIGYNATTGEALRGTWKDLYSTGIAGMSGSGKSNSTRFIVAQSVLAGSRLMLCDPHGASDEPDTLAATLAPLSDRYLFEPAIKPSEIQATLKHAHKLVLDRVEGRSDDRTPLVLIIDELMNIMRRDDLADDAEITLQAISQEGRKVRVYAMAISQQWKHDQISTSTRDSFASFFVHRSRRNSVQKILSGDELREVEGLPAGRAFFYSTRGEQTPLQIPLTTGQDLELLAARLKWQSSGKVAEREAATQPQIAVIPALPQLSAHEAGVIAAFKEGKTVTDIARETYNAAGGQAFKTASKEINDILRKAML
jgi:hypothetical protein